MTYSLRKCTDADEPFLRTLHRHCFHDMVVTQFGAWDAAVQRTFVDRMLTQENLQIVVVDDREVGAVSRFREGDHIRLNELMIDPDFQGKGLGSAIVQQTIQQAESEGIPVRLQVLLANRAIALYSRLGFKEAGRTDTHVKMIR